VRSSSAQHQATGGAGVVNCGLDAHFRVGSRSRARPCACARSKRAALLRLLVPRHDGAAKGPQRARLRRQMTSSLRQVRDVLLARSRQQPRASLVLGMVRRADASRAYRRAVRGRAGGRGRGRARASRLPWAGARLNGNHKICSAFKQGGWVVTHPCKFLVMYWENSAKRVLGG
jgi:hypothetical protein